MAQFDVIGAPQEQRPRLLRWGKAMAGTWYHSRAVRMKPDWSERRKTARKPVNRPAVLTAEGDGALLGECTVLDVSEGGARLKVERPSEIPAYFILVLSRGAGTTRRCEVRWRSATEVGVQFRRPQG